MHLAVVRNQRSRARCRADLRDRQGNGLITITRKPRATRCALLALGLGLLVSLPAAAREPAALLAALERGDAEALTRLAAEATAGDPLAQYGYALAIEAGLTTRPPDTALQWMLAAAEAGLPVAQRLAGNWLYRQSGEDQARALPWWRRAAEQGDARAQYNLAIARLSLDSGADAGERGWLERAAAAGLPEATFALAMLLLEMPEADPARIEALLAQAAATGYRPAQRNLGLLLAADWLPGEAPAPARPVAQAAQPGAAVHETGKGATPDPASPAVVPRAAPGRLDARPERLSDGPADAVAARAWLLAQPADNFTIQLATGSNESALRDLLATQSHAQPGAWFRLPGDSAVLYTAVLGSFASFAAAASTLESLPEAMRETRPWIRRFRELQQLLD